jgi:rubrerythrin
VRDPLKEHKDRETARRARDLLACLTDAPTYTTMIGNGGSEMVKNVCKRCGHKWVKRTEDPVRCPGCKSPYWDREKRK